MESVSDQAKEGIRQHESEEWNDTRSQELYAKELSVPRREQSFFFVDQSKGDDTEEAAEEMGLGSLERVIKLEAIEQ